MSLVIRVKVEPRAAILARKAIAGVMPVTIEEADLASVTEAQLFELAELADASAAGAVLENPLIAEPTFAVVLAVINERLAVKARLVEVEKQDAVDRRNADARAEEADKANQRASIARDAANAKAIGEWLKEHGDDDLRARHAAGFLPMEEVIEEVMHEVFEINEDEYVPLRKEEACDCDKGCANLVRFAVIPVLPGKTPLDARQFSTLDRIKESAPPNATIEPRMHRASCPECKCTPLVRLAARVSLEWHGWMLIKEYSLG